MTLRLAWPDGSALPKLGIGTWRMGESRSRRAAEVAAIVAALHMGWRVIDTAEMYGEGGAEEVVGEALRVSGVARSDVFVVSKVYPHHATAKGTVAACERSLDRLGIDRLDAYLLHWRGQVPLEETVHAFETLRSNRRIDRWGVSNFDVADMDALVRVPRGDRCVVDQIYYSLTRRGPEFDLLPWLRERGIATMAYSPIDQGALARNAKLAAIAGRRGASAAQVALAWLAAQAGVMAIPKATSERHLRENLDAGGLSLAVEELAALDAAFAPPRRKTPLAMT